MSDLKGLAKITRKAELQRKIGEKTDYINRLKIGPSNMVRNYEFENMNEFYLSYKESKRAYAYYQQKVENWEKSYGNMETETNKTIAISEKLVKFENDVESSRRNDKQMKDRGAR